MSISTEQQTMTNAKILLNEFKFTNKLTIDFIQARLSVEKQSVYNLISRLRKDHNIKTIKEGSNKETTYVYKGEKKHKANSLALNKSNLLERCYYLTLAYRRVTVEDVVEVFNIAEGAAQKLMLKVSKKYNTEIAINTSIQCKH